MFVYYNNYSKQTQPDQLLDVLSQAMNVVAVTQVAFLNNLSGMHQTHFWTKFVLVRGNSEFSLFVYGTISWENCGISMANQLYQVHTRECTVGFS